MMAAVRLLQLTDTHISGRSAGEDVPSVFAQAIHDISGRTPSQALELVLDRVLDEHRPDLVVHTGDVVDDGRPASYEQAAGLLAAVDAPTIVTPGNHDDAAAMGAVIAEPSDDGLVSIALDRWQVVLVDSHEDQSQHGVIAPRVLSHLDDTLAATDRHVLVGLHHPPLTVCGHPDCSLRDASQLLALFDTHPQVRGVISGHLHVTEDLQRAGVPYLLSPSTCHQLVHRHPLEDNNDDPTAIGARSLVLHDDGTLESTVTWIGG
jgi:Icc protein